MEQKQYLISKEEYLTAKQKWAKHKHHTAKWHILYNILRSKPADYGFKKKTRAIQGNDPWFAYNTARGFILVDFHNPWKDEQSAYAAAHKLKIEKNKVRFKEVFGIEFVEGILSLMPRTRSR